MGRKPHVSARRLFCLVDLIEIIPNSRCYVKSWKANVWLDGNVCPEPPDPSRVYLIIIVLQGIWERNDEYADGDHVAQQRSSHPLAT